MRDFCAYIAESQDLLLERVEPAITLWDRFRGLMLRRELPSGHGLLIPHCRSVHTCFMRFPIDVIYLSPDNEVLKIVGSMKPWRCSVCLQARSVLEMPGGWAGRARLSTGDTVLFDFAEQGEGARTIEEAPIGSV